MSAWRMVTRTLYEADRAMTTEELADRTVECPKGGLRSAQFLGLVSRTAAPYPGVPVQWFVTDRGIDWCESRITIEWLRPGGRRWVSTWLASLPRGIRLGGAA